MICTHDGGWQTDEVTASAILYLYLRKEFEGESIEFYRTRNEGDWPHADYLVDIGGVYDHERKRYDHHQPRGAGFRNNGVPYASAGLVWLHYGPILTGSVPVAEMVDRRIIQHIDAIDNHFPLYDMNVWESGVYGIADILAIFHKDKHNEHSDESFKKAVMFMVAVLSHEISSHQEMEANRQILHATIKKAYEITPDKRILVFSDIGNWRSNISPRQYPEPLLIVSPRGNSWTVETILLDKEMRKVRMPMPEKWGGLRGDDFVRESGVRGVIFCHSNLYMAKTKNRFAALELARTAIEIYEKEAVKVPVLQN